MMATNRVENRLEALGAAAIVAGAVIYWQGHKYGLPLTSAGVLVWLFNSLYPTDKPTPAKDSDLSALAERVKTLEKAPDPSAEHRKSLAEAQKKLIERVALLEKHGATYSTAEQVRNLKGDLEVLQPKIDARLKAAEESRGQLRSQLEQVKTGSQKSQRKTRTSEKNPEMIALKEQIGKLQDSIRSALQKVEKVNDWIDKIDKAADASEVAEVITERLEQYGISADWESAAEHDKYLRDQTAPNLKKHLENGCCTTTAGLMRLIEKGIVTGKEELREVLAIFFVKKSSFDFPRERSQLTPEQLIRYAKLYGKVGLGKSGLSSVDIASRIKGYAASRNDLTVDQFLDLYLESRRWDTTHPELDLFLKRCAADTKAMTDELERRLDDPSVMKLILDVLDRKYSDSLWKKIMHSLASKRGDLVTTLLTKCAYLQLKHTFDEKTLIDAYEKALPDTKKKIHFQFYAGKIYFSDLLKMVQDDADVVSQILYGFFFYSHIHRVHEYTYSSTDFESEMTSIRKTRPELYGVVYSSLIASCKEESLMWEESEVIQKTSRYVESMVDLAPDDHQWPTKQSLLDRYTEGNDPFGCTEIGVMRSFTNDEWTKEELETVASMISPELFSILKLQQRGWVLKAEGADTAVLEKVPIRTNSYY